MRQLILVISAIIVSVIVINSSVAVGKTNTFNKDDVAKHKTIKDCWWIINGKVYDVSEYVSMHPNPKGTAKTCGTDASEGYNDKGGGRKHTPAADKLMLKYYIGEFKK